MRTKIAVEKLGDIDNQYQILIKVGDKELVKVTADEKVIVRPLSCRKDLTTAIGIMAGEIIRLNKPIKKENTLTSKGVI